MPTRAPSFSGQFKRDMKLAKKRGKNMGTLEILLGLLIDGQRLPECYKDHSLSGDWSSHRECHIEPDWLLIYKFLDTDLGFALNARGLIQTCSDKVEIDETQQSSKSCPRLQTLYAAVTRQRGRLKEAGYMAGEDTAFSFFKLQLIVFCQITIRY